MKVLVVGDLHGKECWRKINFLAYERIVFLGDYVDAFTLCDGDIIRNLAALIQQKEKDPEKIVLLLGNHDIQYLHYPKYRCSGFRAGYQEYLTKIFQANRELFQVAWQEGSYLFTHAGITNAWYKEFTQLTTVRELMAQGGRTIADRLNAIEDTPERGILHQVSFKRGGEHAHGGITWADKAEIEADPLFHYHQVVGHTPVHEVMSIGLSDTSVTFVDVLDTLTHFHEVETEHSPLPGS